MTPIDLPLFVEGFARVHQTDGLEQWFSPKETRRLDPYTKLALLAAAKALDGAEDREEIGLVVASGYGPVQRTCDFMDSIIDDGPLCASPLAFSGSVHNVVETAITMLLSLRGPCLSISQFGTSFESALMTARSWLCAGRCQRVLVGAVDEAHPVHRRLYPNDFHQAGAAFFLLSREGSRRLPGFVEPADVRHPARQAFDLAWRLAPLLDRSDIRQIARDFIKTELARKKQNVLGVFSATEPEALLEKIPAQERQRTLSDLANIFGSREKPQTVEEAVNLCEAAYAQKRQFNFRTSGSTGEPVDCPQNDEAVREEIGGVRFLFGEIRRVVCIVPVHHSYGFIFGLQLPKLLGVPVEFQPALPFLPWNDLLAPGDLLVAFPLFLQQWLESGGKPPAELTVLTATAPCPSELHDALVANGVKRCIEIYGSSEGGAIAWRENGSAPFQLLPHWQGEAVDGCLRKIRRGLTPLEFELPDIAPMEGDRFFRLTGRRDKAVQIAGINVYPAKVEAYLCRHPSVKACAVRLEKQHLKAYIVLHDPAKEAAVRPLLQEYLKPMSAHEIPKKIEFGPSIPVTPFGKKADW